MSAIDEVIARARQGGAGFSERKQFKLARRRAIEKLRRFALADPYFYILEIIQAAIAGGADFVDIACAEGEVLISWTGSSLREDELAQLFDFLFASKERVDLAHVRSLALGVNALMLFEPEQVVIESGDGTPGNTARMVVRAGAESVEVGRGTGTMAGTYVRASKLDRKKVAAETGRKGGDDGGLEYATVETRCLTAPVPLVFNGQPLFGWSRQKVPNLFGYEKARSFDEGDLYGSIGLKPHGGEPSFQLLTHGVWVQSYQYELIKGHKIGGVICFDRLHKTVDHSGFVRDDRFEELWLRLRPHAEAMLGGKETGIAKITSAGGMAYSPNELRELLRGHPRVVLLPPDEANASAASIPTWRGSTIARMLDAELLRVPDTQVSAVRVLGGRDVLVWRPHVDDSEDQEFYNQAPLELPEPYLLPPVDLAAPSIDALVTSLLGEVSASGEPVNPEIWTRVLDEMRAGGRLAVEAREGPLAARVAAQLRVMLGETGAIRATLFTPVHPESAGSGRGLLVRVTSAGRLLEQRSFASAYPGRVLDVELPTAQPSTMRRHAISVRIAEVFAELAVPVLREQDRRTLAGLGVGKIEPDSAAARLALQVLARVTVTRLRTTRPGRMAPGLSFSLLRPIAGTDPFSLELLRTVSGRRLSLRALALLSDETAGLVYGTITEVPADLDGLDTDRILGLDAASERTLIGLLGEAGYVRVDARDVLAEHRGVKVRDIAIGLREYVEFPLPIEGQVERVDSLAILDEQGRAELLDALVQGLVDRMLGRADDRHGDHLAHEEHRRQAVRLLQWYACRELAAGHGDALERRQLLDLPLFIDIDGRAWSLRQVHVSLCSREGLLVHHAHVFGASELGVLTEAVLMPRASTGQPSSLAVSAFCHRLLLPLGRVRIAFDFDLDDIEAARGPVKSAFLVSVPFESPTATGVLGVPAGRLSEYRIQVRVRGRGSIAALDEVAHQYGIVGSIELDDADWDEATVDELLGRIDVHAHALLETLITKLPELNHDDEHEAKRSHSREDEAVRVLLHLLGEQLTLTLGPTGLVAELGSALAQRIASLPLFDTGATTLVSAQRMIDRFRRHFETAVATVATRADAPPVPRLDWSSVLVPGALPSVLAWLDARLQPSRVVTPASVGASTQAASPDPARDEWPTWNPDRRLPLTMLAANLGHWLERLRPDPRERDGQRERATRVWVAPHQVNEDGNGDLIAGGDMRIDIYGAHPLIEQVCASPTASNFGWVLLAVYAFLNAGTTLISNFHEVQFQLIVADALLDGRLRVLELVEKAEGGPL
jgi:hypothetical protein